MINKILEEEIAPLKIESLPTRPTAPSSFGGKGFTASEMKAAFDRLPLFIVERLNMLIDSVFALGDESILTSIPTGLAEGHTLSDLIADITTGAFSEYLALPEGSLLETVENLCVSIGAIKRDMGVDYTAPEYVILDCGKPKDRMEGGLPDAK